ncbi:MAG: hypothetical protein CFH15_00487 [Alphaproteobacteria bacterium MarineAlpha5_Bin5]|nr:MAG: hypothetical protein CFH15_00487 [Alphaproteobacteria bacterium MarineAlpha5_Bin5]PPR51947.1 MAG: hypothetical protein CFH14_00582 [Alphaproteobacteria bacterium MarineAlpha5_Bin4]|tara:strand:- start:27682 stop:28053 length:372 start_codon:yes stop_codon:yes gene_type:complete
MDTKLILRINGIYMALSSLSAFFMPNMWFEGGGLTPNAAAYTLVQAVGTFGFCLAIISWRTADIAGEAIKSFGRLFGILHCIFILLTAYQALTDQFTGFPVYFNIILSLALASAFFYSSRESA